MKKKIDDISFTNGKNDSPYIAEQSQNPDISFVKANPNKKKKKPFGKRDYVTDESVDTLDIYKDGLNYDFSSNIRHNKGVQSNDKIIKRGITADAKTIVLKNGKSNSEANIQTVIDDNEFSQVPAKKLFSQEELKSFEEKFNASEAIHHKPTDEKTEIHVYHEDHLGDIDEVSVGYIIDGKYELIDLLTNKSGEAAIYKCYVKGISGTYVAKIYYPDIQPKEDIMEKILNLDSDNVVQLDMIGFIMTKAGKRLYEIMPFYERGTLEDRMPLGEEEIEEKIVPYINEGLKSIHDLFIIHRDLKPNNLFIDVKGADDSLSSGYRLRNNEHILIGDFGISSQIKDGATHRVTSASRTRGYGAPENIRENITTPKSDYFSFGITILTLLNGEYPYHDEVEMFLKIKDDVWTFPENLSDRMKLLIKGLMTYDRNVRWGYEDVKAWIEKRRVEVKKTPESGFYAKVLVPYDFNFRKYYDIVSLTEACIDNWDLAIHHIKSRYIERYFRGSSFEFDKVIQDMDRLRHINVSNDQILLKMIYSVLKPEGIIYHDVRFKTLDDFSRYILSRLEVDKKIIEMVKNRILDYIFNMMSDYLPELADKDKLTKVLSKISILCKDDEKKAFYLLGFVFNSKRKNADLVELGIFPRAYMDTVKSLEDVYLAFKNATNKDKLSDSLLNDDRFNAWLYYMGYSQNKDFLKGN